MENLEIAELFQESQELNVSANELSVRLSEANKKLQAAIDKLLPEAEAFREFYSKSGKLSMKEVSDRIPMLPNGATNSNQKIIKMLLAVGDVKAGYYGYETLAQGRERGLETRESFDSMGNKHTSVLATQKGFLYIGRALKRFYKGDNE